MYVAFTGFPVKNGKSLALLYISGIISFLAKAHFTTTNCGFLLGGSIAFLLQYSSTHTPGLGRSTLKRTYVKSTGTCT